MFVINKVKFIILFNLRSIQGRLSRTRHGVFGNNIADKKKQV